MTEAAIVTALVRAVLSVAPSVARALLSNGDKALARRRAREKIDREIDNIAAKIALAKRRKRGS